MQTKSRANLIFVRLFPGEQLHESLEKVCTKNKVKTAVVLSGIGQLKEFKLGYFKCKGDYAEQFFREPHELLCLSGNISKQGNKYNFHLHAALGDENKRVIGGHLISGIVEVTNEIVLLKTNLEFKRILEESTGLMGMFLE